MSRYNFDMTVMCELIDGFLREHDLVLECGGEYIYQDDRAQVDSLELVANLFDNKAIFKVGEDNE